jgi:chemotaxis protein histidine kinase CheA
VASDQDAKYRKRLETFRAVAQERLDRLNLGWIQFEQGSGGSAAIGGFLREIHTLKGEAGLTGFSSIARLLHRLEDLVQAVIKSGRPPDAGAGDLVMRGLDVIASVAKRAPEQVSPEIEAFVLELPKPGAVPAPPASPAPPPSPPAAPAAPPSEREAPTLPVSTTPPPAKPPPADQAAAPAKPAPSKETGPQRTHESRRARPGVRLAAEKLDGLRDLVAELLLTRVRLQKSALEVRNAKETALELRRATRGIPESASREIGLLSETLSGLESRLRDEGHQIARLVGELDGTTRELRMVPISSLLERYPVMVRALARRLGRQVQLRTEGESTEVDREVLERLDEPLLHLVQNAVDHGVEDPETRRKAGKPAEAIVLLRSWLAGQTLNVEVRDDGAGIDAHQVRERAVDLKIMDRTTATQTSDEQILRTIFSAGLSTRAKVTEVSGRGIGLNVVLSTVEGLGGQVDVTSKLGEGAVFHLKVPVSVAISAVVLFRAGLSRYAIPASAVETIVELSEHAIVESHEGRALRYGERIVPLLSLEALLGESSSERLNDGRGGRILVVRSGGDRVALTGSHEHFGREVVLKPTGKFFERQPLVSAAIHLEDGSLALVLKPAELVLASRGAGKRGAEEGKGATPRTGFGKTVLVVDDSPVVRDLIADALRAHGIRVIEAADGEEALSKLAAHPSVDLVVTDFEMPRLDGIGLMRALRARGGARRIPAVVVSMRGNDADKRAALDAGADAYLVKSDFSHAGLWTMIARFLG